MPELSEDGWRAVCGHLKPRVMAVALRASKGLLRALGEENEGYWCAIACHAHGRQVRASAGACGRVRASARGVSRRASARKCASRGVMACHGVQERAAACRGVS